MDSFLFEDEKNRKYDISNLLFLKFNEDIYDSLFK
jgi:hypothetical protein